MSVAKLWLVTALVAFGTYALRSSFLLRGGERGVSPRTQQLLQLLPPAVLAALIAPWLVVAGDGLPSIEYEKLVAALLAIVVAWRTKSAIGTLAVGMTALWMIGYLGA